MKRNLKIYIFVIVAAIITGTILNKHRIFNQIKESNKISIKKWDNMYEGYNIQYYFEDKNEMNLEQLNEKYKLDVLVRECEKEFDKSIKIMDWTNEHLKYKENSMNINGNAQEVLKSAKQNGSAVCNYDFCRVYQEAATSIGLKVRIGELRKNNVTKANDKYTHFICEVWCNEYNKWVVFDVCNSHYFVHDSIPLSAVELIKSCGKNISFKGGNNNKKYIDSISKYFSSYTIAIDNYIYSSSNINSQVTYINKNVMPKIYFNDDIVKPSIYTNDSDLFDISPSKKYKNHNSDTIATLIFSKKTNKDSNKITLYGGAFKNSVMIENYYVSINDKPYTKVKDYFDINLKKGENIIKLSEDGSKTQREVIIVSTIE